MKSKKKKPWLAYILGIGLCLLIPCALVGKSVWNEFRAKVGSNKTFIMTAMKDHYDGKNIDERMMESARDQVNTVFKEVDSQMGKFESFGDPDTVPNIGDAISKGWELTYNLPIKYAKGYKTFKIRVRNEGFDQKIVSILYTDGILPHDDVKSRIKGQLP